MKNIEGYNKLRGGYYTPSKISEFIVNWAIDHNTDTILEPSCGDGSFLKAIDKRFLELGVDNSLISKQVTGIELDKTEAKKAATSSANIVMSDFFSYYKANIDGIRYYNVIVGNPPFIRYQNFDEKYRTIAFELMKNHGFHPNRLTNIWLPFLTLSCLALSDTGKLGMVIPAELFQVDYAAETRNFLSTFFERLTILTFKQLVFEGIQQEVILLLGEKTSDQKGISVLELNGIDDLEHLKINEINNAELKLLDHSSEKWVKYYLTNEELSLLSRLNEDGRISNATDLYEVNVGLVSGENSFFLMNKENVVKNKLERVTVPIIGRSEQVKGVVLTDNDFQNLIESQKKVFMFAPQDADENLLDKYSREYIKYGEEQGYSKNYKCRIRKRWYIVPKSWIADAFLIRQANLYPKMILNDKKALVTDTLHKVRFLNNVNGRQVTAAFLNSYTLALSETLGRSYGGGVLTFEPGEMRKFRIPMVNAENLDLNLIDMWQRKGDYQQILSYTDTILLQNGLGLTEYDIRLLHSIWDKMRNRRIGRKNSVLK